MPIKRLRKLYKGITRASDGASLVNEIAEISHGNRWSLDYYDSKLAMVSTQLQNIQEEVKVIIESIEALQDMR